MPSASKIESDVEVPKEEKAAAEQTAPQNESPVAGKSSKPEQDRAADVSEANTLLAQGKRHLFVKDYPNAVATLGDACGLFSNIYGELSYECADAYYNYGCALLELAREDSEVLDVDNKDKESDDSEDANNEADDEPEDEQEDGKQDVETKTADNEQETEGEGKSEGNEEGGDEEEADDENVNNLQLAWEMFELARRSFHEKNDEAKLAETYLKLGEVAMESENYESAISDIKQCLDLQKKMVPPVIREIAQSHFQLGIAYSLSDQFDEAIENFTLASKLLEDRIVVLRGLKEPEPENSKNPFYTVANEIAEIEALLPEIKLKISDTEICKKETIKAVEAKLEGSVKGAVALDGAGSSSNGSSAAAESNRPANDISHLIRKKRKPEDNESENDAKKQK